MTVEQETALNAALAAFSGNEITLLDGLRERHLKAATIALFTGFAGIITATVNDWSRVQAFFAQPINPTTNPDRARELILSSIDQAIVGQDASALVRGLALNYMADKARRGR